MYDILPFPPNITATDTKEQVAQINNYLIQFKEALEFILMNISEDNLSPDLVEKLNSLGTDIKKENEERGEEIQQVSGKMITVSDVLNSSAFKASVTELEEKIQEVDDKVITVTDVVESEEYQTDFSDMKAELEETLPPAVVTAMNLRVNFETGELEYDKEVETE